ncbi:toprim domain-containing protein [Dyadobacter sp. CY343]|uniref:toprim domain-containing protein n=1 Tax=Dyadobacter sp. CY343 TaxID=2907299 RepID=UPI001F2C896E|nr:toprim domain-containing protein [Dyadobacter sp. CY343]MCE7059728.1 toprim domain-containing protein [Dyadobacter sp. CY343]
MTTHSELITLQTIKDTDMTSYLADLGIEPARVQGPNYWYHSPLREERTPSFKINLRLNRWFDYGIGKGGNLIDFGILYHQCSVSDLLQKFRSGQHARPHSYTPVLPSYNQPENKLHILEEKPIHSVALVRYLSKRGIDKQFADQVCREVLYELGKNRYYSIGFRNDSGGWELRNQYSKISSSPKDVTRIDNGSKEVCVFEGFFDLLSYQVIARQQQLPEMNYLVLNSIALFQRARPFLERHQQAHLFLDHDLAGRTLTANAISLHHCYCDAAGMYENFKDVNDWLLSVNGIDDRTPKQRKSIELPGRI